MNPYELALQVYHQFTWLEIELDYAPASPLEHRLRYDFENTYPKLVGMLEKGTSPMMTNIIENALAKEGAYRLLVQVKGEETIKDRHNLIERCRNSPVLN